MVRLRQGKNKRWRKGQSCESNPATRTHRDAAKKGAIVGHATRNSNLTVDALARHEEKHDEEGDVELKDEERLSVKSGQTFGAFSVSGLTDCSNPVFATVRRFWDSPSSQHKEVSSLKLRTYLFTVTFVSWNFAYRQAFMCWLFRVIMCRKFTCRLNTDRV